MIEALKRAIGLSRESGPAVVSIAQRALKRPQSLSPEEIKSLAASVLSQSARRK